MPNDDIATNVQNPVEENKTQQVEFSFKSFLESRPPGGLCAISDLWHWDNSYNSKSAKLNAPELMLHCTHKDCNGPRYFRCITDYRPLENGAKSLFVDYKCSNCGTTHKRYALYAVIDTKSPAKGLCEKYGEVPAFGPPTSTKLLRLLGNDKDVFLKGRRSEMQGLGIGAYAYYRRIVESHKDNIFDEIIGVCEKIGASQEIVSGLNTAKQEVQFKKALEKAKEVMPAALLINGHNPLTLLHSALSSGIHAKSDAECLELANDIRIVLSELANRLGQALSDKKELHDAVNRLVASKQKKSESDSEN
ncbi:MAG: hypothetical protein ABI230_02865 [Aestuariivirga sp.]